MKDVFKRKIYQEFDSSVGYPAANHIFYECIQCGDIIPSIPDDNITCTCRNISIDIDYGRVSIKDESLLKVFMGH